jgi:hypothetical protein
MIKSLQVLAVIDVKALRMPAVILLQPCLLSDSTKNNEHTRPSLGHWHLERENLEK